MYASQVDYQKLNGQPSAWGAARAPRALGQAVIEICFEAGITHVLLLGPGQGEVTENLQRAGLTVMGSDLDLAGEGSAAAREALAARQATEAAPWVSVCLPGLQAFDAEDLADVFSNLRTLSAGPVVAAFSTLPSASDNRYHATLLPSASWTALFEAAGFLVRRKGFASGVPAAGSTDTHLLDHWRQANPFQEGQPGGEAYVLLDPVERGLPEEASRVRMASILDVRYCLEKRQHLNGLGASRVGLNIHHLQDFILLRPLLDILPRESVVAMLRVSTLDVGSLSLARGFFERCGVQTICYDRCSQILWRELALDQLLTAAESNVNASHLMSRQVVEAAKLHQVHTVHLQHGIWIEQFEQRHIEFGSETILSWGKRYEEFVRESEVDLAGAKVRVRTPDWQRFICMGGPKFTDLKLAPPVDLLRWRLGVDTSQFKSVALLGTNLLWNRHGESKQSTRARLAEMIRSMPDVFFVVKLHPSERTTDVPELAQTNSIVLDDMLMGAMDLHITRLIRAVDVVVSSLSTLLLDAAVAGKPCVQYDTGNDLSYVGSTPVDIAQIPRILENVSVIPVNEVLVREYAEASGEPFYARLMEVFAETRAADSAGTQASGHYCSAAEVENLWAHLQHAQAEHAKAAALVAAIQGTRAWRATAPIRWIRRKMIARAVSA